jgi:hypothetical protein
MTKALVTELIKVLGMSEFESVTCSFALHKQLQLKLLSIHIAILGVLDCNDPQ